MPGFTRLVPFAVPPELDGNALPPTACFECARADVASLETCPRCGLVAFCSKACNKANLGRKGPFMHRCAITFFGVKDPGTIPVVWGQLWKEGKGKKGKGKKGKDKKGKDKKKPKSAESGLNPKTEFFKSLEFNDGNDYDKMPGEEISLQTTENVEVMMSIKQAEDQPFEVTDECVAEKDMTTLDDTKAVEFTDAIAGSLGSGELRCCSRKRWKNSERAQVTKNLLKVSLRLSKHTILAEQDMHRESTQDLAGRRLFPCSSENINQSLQSVSARTNRQSGLRPDHARGGKVSGTEAETPNESGAQTDNGANLFMETGAALGILEEQIEGNGMEGNGEAVKKTPRNVYKGVGKKADETADKSSKQVKRKTGMKDVAKTTTTLYNPGSGGKQSTQFEVRKEPVGNSKGNTLVCQVMRCDESRQEWDGQKRLVAVPQDVFEYFPARAICALLGKLGMSGGAAFSPDVFLLPYAIYKNGDLYYCVKEPSPPACDNSSFV